MQDTSSALPLVLGGGVGGGGGQSYLGDSGDYRPLRSGCLVTIIVGWVSIMPWSAGGVGKGEASTLQRKDPFSLPGEKVNCVNGPHNCREIGAVL